MKRFYKILLIKSNPGDTELVRDQLERLDYQYQLVIISERENFLATIKNESPNLIIYDYKHSDTDNIEALKVIRESYPDIPFILISEDAGIEQAVDCMVKSASDFVMKQNIECLGAAVKKELDLHKKINEQSQILEHTRSHFESLVQTIDGIFWEADAETFEFLYISPQSQRILGYKPSEWYNNTFWQNHIHPDDREYAIRYCHEKTKAGKNHEFEYRMIASDGRIVWIRDTVSVIDEDTVSPARLRGIMMDITDQKEVRQERDEALHDLKERMKEQKCLYNISSLDDYKLSISELLQQAVLYLPEGFQFPEIAAASIEYDGETYSTENIVKTRQSLSTSIDDLENGPLVVTVTYLKSGPELNENPFSNEERYLLKSVAKNIALKVHHILNRKELREKQDLLERAYDLAQMGNWEVDLVESKVYWSPTTKKIHEVPEEFMPSLEKAINFYIEGEDRDKIKRLLTHAIEEGESYDSELRILTAKGNEKWIRTTGEPEFEDGKCIRLFGSFQDIDKRKRTEEEIYKREQRFKALVQDGVDLIAIMDAEGFYQYVSPTSQRLKSFGMEQDEFNGIKCYDLIHVDDRERVKKIIDELEPNQHKEITPYRFKNRLGEWRWLETNITNLINNPAINGYVANSRDVTDRIGQERKLREIVEHSTNLFYRHDVNNVLTYVSPQSIEFLGCSPEEAKIRWTEFATDHPINEIGFEFTRKAIETGEPQQLYELELQKVSGEKIWVEVNEAPIVENGKTVAMVGSLTDITERKDALEKLINTEQKLREIVEYSTNLFYKHDVNHQLEYISPQSYDFVGLTPEEAMTKWTDLVTDHPINKIGFQKTMKAIETGKPQGPYELQFKHVDGSIVWARIHEAPVIEDGETVAIVGSLTDITEEKKYEEKLEELSQIAAKTTDLIFVADTDHRITWVNTAFEKLTGYTLDESIGKLPSELLFGPESNKRSLQRIDDKLEAKETVKETIQIVSKTGKKYWMDTTIDLIFDEEKDLTRFITIQKDVTEKIEKEKALQESLERYDIVTKATSDTIWDADLIEDTVTYNSNIHEIFGYDANEVENSGEWWLSKIHPDDRERIKKTFTMGESEKRDRVQAEYRFQCADESYKYINDRAYIITDEEGNPVRMIGAMQDITKQVEENQWLKLLESAIDNATEAITVLEARPTEKAGRKILYANDAFEKMTGYSREEAVGETLYLLGGPKTDEKRERELLTALDNWESHTMEIINYKKNGDEFWSQVSFDPVEDSQGNYSHWITVGRDITERKKREQELKESLLEKQTLLMEIHHRVKNNLAVVSSMMQLQAMDETDESMQRKLYDSVFRIRTMVTIHELLYESRSFSKISFDENLRKLVSMIMETMQKEDRIDLKFRCNKVELNVNQAIPSSLIVNEVVTNVIKHAFPEDQDGKITVELRETNGQIEICIRDNGVGIPKNFDLQNTTSLGMKLINVLSAQMDANYNYFSPSGNGTTFEIKFEKASVKGIGNQYL